MGTGIRDPVWPHPASAVASRSSDCAGWDQQSFQSRPSRPGWRLGCLERDRRCRSGTAPCPAGGARWHDLSANAGSAAASDWRVACAQVALAEGLPADVARPDAAAAHLLRRNGLCWFCIHAADIGRSDPVCDGARAVGGLVSGLVAPGRRTARSVLVALTAPLYWPLQSIAMARAIYGLCHAPHFWAKTRHGASTCLKPPPRLLPGVRLGEPAMEI